jgi:hypothetical protein
MKTIEGITLNWLHERVKDEDGCLVWQKCISGNGVPQGYIGGKVVTVRRFLWNESHEEPCPANMQVRPKCNNPLCVKPSHLRAYPKNEFHKGKAHALPWRNAYAQTARANSRFSDELINEIRDSQEPGRVLAERHGMSETYVSRIRRGKARQDYTNPYLQLMARA